VWSPDGTKIAFVKRIKNSYNIFVMDADGKNQVNVTNNLFKNWDPDWSPDGQKIIFSSDKPLITLPSDYKTTIDPPRDIYILDLTVNALKRLTNDENDVEDDIFDDTYPSWCHPKEDTPTPYRTVIVIVSLSTLLMLFIFLKKTFSKT
jgi:Tol biopolymer transport system component